MSDLDFYSLSNETGNLVNEYWELYKNREPFQMSLRAGEMCVDLLHSCLFLTKNNHFYLNLIKYLK